MVAVDHILRRVAVRRGFGAAGLGWGRVALVVVLAGLPLAAAATSPVPVCVVTEGPEEGYGYDYSVWGDGFLDYKLIRTGPLETTTRILEHCASGIRLSVIMPPPEAGNDLSAMYRVDAKMDEALTSAQPYTIEDIAVIAFEAGGRVTAGPAAYESCACQRFAKHGY